MLPEHLRTQLFPEQPSANAPSPRSSIVDLIHANQVQTMVSRTAAAQFAHTHGLNLIDFHVVQSVISLGDEQETATPGYIARGLSLSASTLTSILERLVRAGHLVRERDSADRRRISIYHTEKSARLMADFYRHLAARYEEAFEAADDEQVRSHIAFVSELEAANSRVVAAFEESGDNLRSATQGRAALADAPQASAVPSADAQSSDAQPPHDMVAS
ncbi:MAG TPA: MarR family winged helix-turn-helix transcriptional regulator [Brevibacterium sp.]|nr:MarR family winged helix-turn-helix transcriptional regulator [Brevibacterium sp.]HLS32141.1 MarR family winged helix-turn-helix transcriptional regulator [Brevibacterium sp.]